MTRDELIARTRQLIDEGDRLEADPSLGVAPASGSSAPTTCSRPRGGRWTATTSSWLMVGKPKDIVRGRPMTADEEAAYVREVAEQKTAALRMSLDAVERQHMPFAGETGGLGAGRCLTVRRRGRPPTRPRAGGRRHPDRPGARPGRPRLPAPRAPARPAHPRARRRLLRPGRPQGRRSTWSSSARRPGCATTPSRCAPGSPPRSTTPDRRAWLDAQLVALETQAAALAGEPLPYLDHVARCFAFAPAAPRRRRVRGGRGPDRRAAPGRRAARRAPRGLGRARFEIAVDRLPGGHRLARRRGSATAPRRCSGCRTARTCGSRWSRTSRGPATTGTTAAAGRGSTSTPTCRSARRPRPHRRPRDVPGPPPRARLEGGGPRRRRGPPRGVDPAHQHARVPDQRGPGGPRARRSRSPTTSRPTCSSSCSSGPGCAIAGDPRRRARRRRAVGGARRPARRALAAIRGNAAILRHADGRSHDEVLDYLRTVGRFSGRTGGEAARVHRASALADVRLRLRRGRGAAAPLARRRAGRRTGRPGSAGSCTSS